jgi:protein phosphatase 1 regulatory subunit 42
MLEWNDYLCSPEDDCFAPSARPASPVPSDFNPGAYLHGGLDPHCAPAPTAFCQELENRRIEVSNFDCCTMTRDVVLSHASRYGDVESVDLRELSSGRVHVTFYDLRDACAMRCAAIDIGACRWMIQFAPLHPIVDPKKVPNTGTIVVLHLRPTVTNKAVKNEFSHFGEVRDVRSTPDRRSTKFIEYWDVRNAKPR